MPVWIVWTLIASMGMAVSGVGREAEAFWRAEASSRRMLIHSVLLRLLCWKRSMMGVERRREAYWRNNWDLRSSGGLCDGGWVGGKRCIGTTAGCTPERWAAGVVAVTVAYKRRLERTGLRRVTGRSGRAFEVREVWGCIVIVESRSMSTATIQRGSARSCSRGNFVLPE